MPTASNAFSMASQSGTVRGIVAFVQYDGHLFQLLGYSTDSFASSFESTVDVATLALINQLETTSRLEAGKPYKVATGGTY